MHNTVILALILIKPIWHLFPPKLMKLTLNNPSVYTLKETGNEMKCWTERKRGVSCAQSVNSE